MRTPLRLRQRVPIELCVSKKVLRILLEGPIIVSRGPNTHVTVMLKTSDLLSGTVSRRVHRDDDCRGALSMRGDAV